MTNFTEIAIPHRDIFEGRFTLDTYASDLWEVVKGSAPDEYKDRDIFFKRTFETAGLREIASIVERRIKGGLSDPVVQLQTPFGGGKTHTLIYLFHKAKEWGAKVFAFVGDKIGANDITIWEEMERQLSGRIDLFKGYVVPGGEKIKEFLMQHEPLLILMDEVHAYLVNAQAKSIGESNLASQSLLFIQTLTNVVKSMEKTAMFMSLPASSYYSDEKAERLLSDLKQLVGRVERVYTPVTDEEVSDVIRRRLFYRIDDEKAKDIIVDFINFLESENILPHGVEKSQYKAMFIRSYPFQPELIEILYKRWGSYPSFQRTRGVLRLLALVVHSMIKRNKPFIRLSDLDLSNEAIRRELIKHIGNEYDSIIAQDITSENSGAKKVDKSLGDSYRAYCFGTSVSTTIFMYSFSGGGEKGANINDIKLATAEKNISSSIIIETIEKLKGYLFYLSEDGLFFKNKPNLNKILIDRMDSVSDNDINNFEEALLRKSLKGETFENYFLPIKSNDIPDTPVLKLIITKKENDMDLIYKNYGERPRKYKNTIFFITQDFNEVTKFTNEVKKRIAWERILDDKLITLNDEQKKEIKDRLKNLDNSLKAIIRNVYRKLFIPSKEGLKLIDLGLSTYGKDRSIDEEIYERLKSEEICVTKLAQRVLIDKFLTNHEYMETKRIYNNFLTIPGEIILSKDVLKKSIIDGVRDGFFGLGIMDNGEIKCLFFKKECDVSFIDDEFIIKEELCKEKKEKEAPPPQNEKEKNVNKSEEKSSSGGQPPPIEPPPKAPTDKIKQITLDLIVPSNKISDISRTLLYLNQNFRDIKVEISIEASEGEISKADYDGKVVEAFMQAGIKIQCNEVK